MNEERADVELPMNDSPVSVSKDEVIDHLGDYVKVISIESARFQAAALAAAEKIVALRQELSELQKTLDELISQEG